MELASAALAPASIMQPVTKKVMEAKNISLETHFPKDLEHVPLSGFDLIVNISGRKLPTPCRSRSVSGRWKIRWESPRKNSWQLGNRSKIW